MRQWAQLQLGGSWDGDTSNTSAGWGWDDGRRRHPGAITALSVLCFVPLSSSEIVCHQTTRLISSSDLLWVRHPLGLRLYYCCNLHDKTWNSWEVCRCTRENRRLFLLFFIIFSRLWTGQNELTWHLSNKVLAEPHRSPSVSVSRRQNTDAALWFTSQPGYKSKIKWIIKWMNKSFCFRYTHHKKN